MKKNMEKRKAARRNVHHLVKYRLVKEPGKKLVLASIKDISPIGARLLVNEKLLILSQVQVYINFPWLTDAVSVLAKVVWISSLGRSKKFECGLEFLELDEKIRKDLGERIANAR